MRGLRRVRARLLSWQATQYFLACLSTEKNANKPAHFPTYFMQTGISKTFPNNAKQLQIARKFPTPIKDLIHLVLRIVQCGFYVNEALPQQGSARLASGKIMRNYNYNQHVSLVAVSALQNESGVCLQMPKRNTAKSVLIC